jgi:hypothetical protein
MLKKSFEPSFIKYTLLYWHQWRAMGPDVTDLVDTMVLVINHVNGSFAPLSAFNNGELRRRCNHAGMTHGHEAFKIHRNNSSLTIPNI